VGRTRAGQREAISLILHWELWPLELPYSEAAMISLPATDLKAVVMKTNRSPIIRANQAHRIGCGDCEASSIAGVSGAGAFSILCRMRC
jgi:hypothetical protein